MIIVVMNELMVIKRHFDKCMQEKYAKKIVARKFRLAKIVLKRKRIR